MSLVNTERALQWLPATAGLIAAFLVPGCFNPDLNPGGEGTTAGGGTDVGAPCTPGATEPCVCPDGTASNMSCGADGTLGACACGGADSSGGTSPGMTDDGNPTDGNPTDGNPTDGNPTDGNPTDGNPTDDGPIPECVSPGDCAAMAGECEAFDCVDGSCEISNLAAGELCGADPVDTCDAPDRCDGMGVCVDELLGAGAPCAGCPAGPGLCGCTAGACADCTDFATLNTFASDLSISGWTLEGDWGLRAGAPMTSTLPGVAFGKPRFGTDGNRSQPFPGAENEVSAAETAVTVLPATLEFTSWHVDEGGIQDGADAYDQKRIFILPEGGGPPVPVVDCQDTAGLAAYAFCQLYEGARPADEVDVISIPVPAAWVGTSARVRFEYDTTDTCCGDEQGWFLDNFNFATVCACVDDAGCGFVAGPCGGGTCSDNSECVVNPGPVGAACGDVGVADCDQPDACSAFGYCDANLADNRTVCSDCAGGAGACNTCEAGACAECENLEVDATFSAGVGGWSFVSLNAEPHGWGQYFSAPPNQNGDPAVALSTAPALGTDGNRVPPYTTDAGQNAHAEYSQATSSPDTVPAALTFRSWHRDEGVDQKIIELSVDAGMTWNSLADCADGPIQPFCADFMGIRAGDDWDDISLDTGAWEGMEGILRITYNAGDTCCGFEQGWFIDDLNFGQFCSDLPVGTPM